MKINSSVGRRNISKKSEKLVQNELLSIFRVSELYIRRILNTFDYYCCGFLKEEKKNIALKYISLSSLVQYT